MLEAFVQVILGIRNGGIVVAWTHEGSTSWSESGLGLVTPKTCRDGCSHSSKMRGIGCGALRKRTPVFRAFSALLGYEDIRHHMS